MSHAAPPAARPRARITRVPVFHEGAFLALVAAALEAQSCLKYRGRLWEPVEVGRQVAFYRLAPYRPGWLRERVEQYEFHFYRRLLQECYGRDGLLRPHARVVRRPNGALCRRSPASDTPA